MEKSTFFFMIEFLNIKIIVAHILNDKERLVFWRGWEVRVGWFVSGGKLCVRKCLFRICVLHQAGCVAGALE